MLVETFKLVCMGILVIITYVYLFVLISKLPKAVAITLYVIVGISIIAIIVLSIWYPGVLRPVVDYLNLVTPLR